jgi:hypothetical protein
MVPLSWLLLRSKDPGLHSCRTQSQQRQTPRCSLEVDMLVYNTTHVKRVNDPRKEGMVPVIWLPKRPKYLCSRVVRNFIR